MNERGLEQSLSAPQCADYELRLYVGGMSLRSIRAIENIKRCCEAHLPGHYVLRVIDIYHDPAAARTEQLLAAPTLIKDAPLPVRRFVGDLSDTKKLLSGLGLQPAVA